MYLGNKPALSYTSFAKQDFTTSATTSYTLDNPVANANELALFINNVRQEPTTAYSASGTTLTLTEATSSSDDMYCVFLGKAVQTVNPPNNSVNEAQLNYPLTTFSSTGIDDNASSNAITIDNSQRVGIGTTSPSYQLSLNSNGIYSDDDGLHIEQNTSQLDTLELKSQGTINHVTNFDDGTSNSDHIFKNYTTELMRLTSAGHLWLGQNSTNTPGYGASSATTGTSIYPYGRFFISQSSFSSWNKTGTGTLLTWRNAGSTVGSIVINASSTSYNTTSDYRLKENLNYEFDATNVLKQLKPVKFNFVNDEVIHDGFIAHEASSVLPYTVSGEKDALDENGNIEPQQMDYSKLVPVLTKALQEANTKIEELEARITELENK